MDFAIAQIEFTKQIFEYRYMCFITNCSMTHRTVESTTNDVRREFFADESQNKNKWLLHGNLMLRTCVFLIAWHALLVATKRNHNVKQCHCALP